jgi:dienelactone hydrolase
VVQSPPAGSRSTSTGCPSSPAAAGPLQGVVSFHGNLDTPNPADARNIKAKVVAFQGGDDPFIPPEQVLAFWHEMKQARVDYQIVILANAVHSFTNSEAASRLVLGMHYPSDVLAGAVIGAASAAVWLEVAARFAR